MITTALWIALALGVEPGPAAPGPSAVHPNSYSISELHVRGAQIEVQLRCQVLSLAEVLDGFDPDQDGHAEDGEIEANRAAIADYVEAHYRIVPGAATNAEAADGSRALRRIEALVMEAPLALDPMNEVSEWVDVRLRFRAEEDAFERLGVHVDLFEVTSPGHRDSSALVWNGVEMGAWQFAMGASDQVFVATEEVIARAAPALQRYAIAAPRALGAAYDVVLLALLFVLAARPGRGSAALTVSLFAVAAASGLLLAPHVDLKPQHVRFLQLTVPLAVAYVALDDLLHASGRTRIVEPLVFGVVVGGREAAALAPELVREETAGPALAGFALGFVGLLLAMSFAVIFALGRRDDTETKNADDGQELGALASRPLRLVVGVFALIVGAALFGWRTFGPA